MSRYHHLRRSEELMADLNKLIDERNAETQRVAYCIGVHRHSLAPPC